MTRQQADDQRFMARAIELAAQGFPAPNPHVGCVIAKRGRIIAEGWHEYAGAAHAEVHALRNATESVEGATVYVTLEPCNHTGRTGPCSLALIEARVRRVVIAVSDPNPAAAGGASTLHQAGIKVDLGVLAREASHINRQFLTSASKRRPYITLKAAITRDGFIARPDGTSKWITGEEARQDSHRLRAERGAVLVGRGTVQADDPQLTARISGIQNPPTRIVLDPAAKLAGNEKVFDRSAPTWWYVSDPSRPNQKALPESMADFLQDLDSAGIRGVLVEGGSATLTAFLNAGLGDELVLYEAPVMFKQGLPWHLSQAKFWMVHRETAIFGRDRRFTYDLVF
jgi:diaminohydroxyphosphoribosylaminopyrimidine deaminase / 5-amino-6-(5-phosphoribosylamino)uracil reductase